LVKCVASPLKEPNAGICNSHASMMPFKQRYTKFVFERTDPTAQCRLPKAQRTCCASDAQVLGDDQCMRDGNRVNPC
jgi:hypothetical protein